MRLMFNFFRTYRAPTLLMLLALLLSGLAEGLGLSALLPLLNIALGTGRLTGDATGATSGYEQLIVTALDDLGIATTLGNMLLIVLAGVFLKSVFLLAAQRQVGYTAAQVGTDLRLKMLRAVLRSRWEYFLHQPAGKLTNSLATEAERSSQSFVHGATAITFLIQSLIYGGVAFALSWKASLVAIVAGAIVIGLSHFLVLITRRAGRRQTRMLSSLVGNLTDILQSVKPIKAMAREQRADQVLAEDTRQLNRALRRQVLSAALLDSAQELMFALFICLGIFVALAVYAMALPTVMVLVVALGRAFSFLGKVQKQYQKLVQGESAYWAMLDSIAEADAAAEASGGAAPAPLAAAIELNDVSFSYDGREPVFTGLDLRIPAGSLTTLVGPSGTGKTTLVDLVIGLLRPTAGAVLIDGRDLADLDARGWRRQIGYVPQDTVLLHASILQNVTLDDPALTPADAEQALRDAGAWDFIAAMPQGMDTVVGERGGRLSGGQRQRVVIARALINAPRLLILDEATSALDADSERAVRQTMEALKGRLTILAISHNRAMIDAADRVYRLSGGRAVAEEPAQATG
mgnify:CR=1 FL=1